MLNDTELQQHVEKELAWDSSVHTRQIGVTAKDGAVHLLGHVDTYWQRCAAECAAWRVAHVKSVVNELRVDLPFDSLRADDDIALAAMSILEWNCLTPKSVDVQVVDGFVILSGQAEWQHEREEAERALRALVGIKGIRNEIAIQPGKPPGEVRAAIEDALKRNALVNSGHIKVHVSHGIVGLHGSAHSRAERDEALRAAWSTPGITALEDHITIV